MNSAESVELAIRTAQLMKAVAGMIGIGDAGLARAHMADIGNAAMELDRFVESLQ